MLVVALFFGIGETRFCFVLNLSPSAAFASRLGAFTEGPPRTLARDTANPVWQFSNARAKVQLVGCNMGMPEISSDWKPSYVMAMRELNRARLQFLVTDAEKAVSTRFSEIADSPGHDDERAQMSDALEDLQAVRLNLLA